MLSPTQVQQPEFGLENYFKSCPAVLIFGFPVSHHLHLLEPLSRFVIHGQTGLFFELHNLCVSVCVHVGVSVHTHYVLLTLWGPNVVGTLTL